MFRGRPRKGLHELDLRFGVKPSDEIHPALESHHDDGFPIPQHPRFARMKVFVASRGLRKKHGMKEREVEEPPHLKRLPCLSPVMVRARRQHPVQPRQ